MEDSSIENVSPVHSGVFLIESECMKINKNWHLKNKMPKNPTPNERLKWHLGHSKNCSCRLLTKEFLEKLKKKI